MNQKESVDSMVRNFYHCFDVKGSIYKNERIFFLLFVRLRESNIK